MITNDTKELLRRNGLRATKPRIRLLEHLASIRAPQGIVEMVEALARSMDHATVYRTIQSFLGAGIVREVELHRGRPLYELADEHDHHHIVCTSCARVEEFTGCAAERIVADALAQVRGFANVQSHSFELFGTCNRCARV